MARPRRRSKQVCFLRKAKNRKITFLQSRPYTLFTSTWIFHLSSSLNRLAYPFFCLNAHPSRSFRFDSFILGISTPPIFNAFPFSSSYVVVRKKKGGFDGGGFLPLELGFLTYGMGIRYPRMGCGSSESSKPILGILGRIGMVSVVVIKGWYVDGVIGVGFQCACDGRCFECVIEGDGV